MIKIWLAVGLIFSMYLFQPKDIVVNPIDKQIEVIQPMPIEEVKDKYRLTYYHTGDNYGSGTCTASGLCINHFKTNSKGWYTYQGKLVIATAVRRYIPKSKYGLQEHITYRNIKDELTIEIDGIEYEAIVLDICGFCHKEQRIDLFVSNKKYGIDRKEIYVSEMAKEGI